jgi:hypothetical protein
MQKKHEKINFQFASQLKLITYLKKKVSKDYQKCRNKKLNIFI